MQSLEKRIEGFIEIFITFSEALESGMKKNYLLINIFLCIRAGAEMG